jgi:hypothetical protein
MTATPVWSTVRTLGAEGLITWPTRAISLLAGTFTSPYRVRGKPPSQKAANPAHARLRARGERADAQLKTWHILCKLRCCPGGGPSAGATLKPAKCRRGVHTKEPMCRATDD